MRRIGYLIGDVAVELRSEPHGAPERRCSGASSRSTRCASSRRRSRYADFEYRRKNNPIGPLPHRERPREAARHRAGAGDPARRAASPIVGFGPERAGVLHGAPARADPNCKEVNVVIDGVDQATINMVPPHDIAAMEIYAEAAGAPGQYRAECGLILIWTKKWRRYASDMNG